MPKRTAASSDPPSKRRRSSRQAAVPRTDSKEDGTPGSDSVPAVNPEAPRHEGEWYWLMKAEPEPRMEKGVDVSFSIDCLRAKKEPEPWDGIRAYAARNNLRQMNVHDKSFFYHSNCKEPAIVGTMEIVKEYSPDKTALDPDAPYHDPASTRDKQRWSVVHVEFRRKFAVPISLRELRQMGKAGGALEGMQMLRQSRLSVSRVSSAEWEALCRLADEKAAEAGLEHED
ncbi:thymocyte nuclear protein 1 [Ophiocordyceps camponoti-floridani]|uniref:Thymocyte nuclear protein 1 n=1 Tax=Ophiocordyceps camponoti-floridani TaxID=2030778 RepID=A0A8H4QBA8_9HYPO|nr:thymocyte nuclear protein 1 [Ophiocordyceps camponoti-floridani]